MSEPGSGHAGEGPGVSWPETVLVARMTSGDCFLMACPQCEPLAVVASADTGPLRDVLRAAFARPTRKEE